MAESDSIAAGVPLSHLPKDEKARRAASFGGAARQYERYRPGPPEAAVDWILGGHLHRVVDLGAGTGALARLLVDRADEVLAVEPDDRMRAVLVEEVPGVEALKGTGESMPIPDHHVDAVVAASSWHWMDVVPALREVGRVLVPGGVLGALWQGPDTEGPFFLQAQALLAGRGEPEPDDSTNGAGSEGVGGLILGDAERPAPVLEIPAGMAFHPPELGVFTWDIAMNADELIGLLGTLNWVITLPDERRERVMAEARRLLRELLGVDGEVTVDVAFRCNAWRSRRFE